jgi:hypothetical protein
MPSAFSHRLIVMRETRYMDGRAEIAMRGEAFSDAPRPAWRRIPNIG